MMSRQLRVYADISVFGGVFDSEFSAPSKKFFDEVVAERSLTDALHVAMATVSECELIVSWNFRDIVHFEKIPKYSAVNVLNGYAHIDIHSPLEMIQHDEP